MTEELDAAAAERRERLRALRAAAQLSSSHHKDGEGEKDEEHGEEGGDDGGNDDSEPEQEVKFRNYLPHDKQFEPKKLPPPTLPKFDDPIVPSAPPPSNGTEDPILSIAPKKANWDLRRDVAKKLETLDRRTQRALIELMQEEERRRQELTEENTAEMEET